MDEVWGVEVNEISVLTYGGSDADWWTRWRAFFERIGRITILGSAIPADVVHVACQSREDARELMASWTENKLIHKGAMKVRKITEADVSAEKWATVTDCLERLRASVGADA